jgi:hypothetical protein
VRNVLLGSHHMKLLSLRYIVCDDLLHCIGTDVARSQNGRLEGILHLLQISVVGLYHGIDERHLDGGGHTARGSDRESGKR